MGVPLVEGFQHIRIDSLHVTALNSTDTVEAIRDALFLAFRESRTVLLNFPRGARVKIDPDEITELMITRLEQPAKPTEIAR